MIDSEEQKPAVESPYTPTPDLVYRGEREPSATTVRIFDFSTGGLQEVEAERAEDIFPYLNTAALTWIDWVGLRDIDRLRLLCERMGVHPLHIEDLIHTDQRSKIEDAEEYTLIFTRRIFRSGAKGRCTSNQLALILTPTTLVSIREQDLGLFAPVQARLRLSKGRIRSMGCDYLAYALLDTLIDSYFTVLNELEEEIEGVQEAVLEAPHPRLMAELHGLRSDLLVARKTMSPLREVIGSLARTDRIQPETAPFLRDAYEHTVKVVDTLEFARDLLNATMESYMSSTSNRMNETIRLLTVISLIFMPLTFIAGIYGMNFEHMPELRWRYGYLATWTVMIATTAGMVAVFRRKRWI